MTDTVNQWLTMARQDLKSANTLFNALTLENSGDEAWHNVLFLAQQSAEKYLKTVLVKNQQDVPHIHDIVTLCDQIKPYIPISIARIDLIFLSLGAVKMRYPGDEPTGEMAEHAIAIATKIQQAILNYFNDDNI